jgi:hypothetical protein
LDDEFSRGYHEYKYPYIWGVRKAQVFKKPTVEILRLAIAGVIKAFLA